MENTEKNPKEGVMCVEPHVKVSRGSAGLRSQVYGHGATVTALAEATGGIGNGNLVL